MKDDYLWDRNGTPDPEVERLEKLLGRYRHTAPLRRSRSPRAQTVRGLTAAAAALVLLFGLTLAIRFYWPAGRAWDIVAVSGNATIDGRPIDRHDRFAIGRILRTTSGAHVVARVARVGEIAVGPDSEVELVQTTRKRHRIALRRGTVSVRVWAPPFTFGIYTPAGAAYDLGCAFVLRHQTGGGLLHVTSGAVDFEGSGRSAVVRQGAISELSDEHGPGTPYWHDAPLELREALRAFDRTGSSAALQRVIVTARARDAMTLHHLLERVAPPHRARLFDALAAIAPPPPGVTREGILERDIEMLHAWSKSLGLQSVKKWWLYWRDALPQS